MEDIIIKIVATVTTYALIAYTLWHMFKLLIGKSDNNK